MIIKRKFYLILSVTALIIGILSFVVLTNTRAKDSWPPEFKIVEIPSSQDRTLQFAYIYKSTGNQKQPLVVSLHTWASGYGQFTFSAASQAKAKNWNFIHPDFRGPNRTPQACASPLVISDIEDAIRWALEHLRADPERIYVVGGSGGGYAALAMFMKSTINIKGYSVWVPISDLVQWFEEVQSRTPEYRQDILNCTDSFNEILNIEEAKKRSPYYWATPVEKLNNTKLQIFAGIRDGLNGSVPITQSILFYNKILTDLKTGDPSAYVSFKDISFMLENRYFPQNGKNLIGGRKIHYQKNFGNLSLIIFEGGHEMLEDHVLELIHN